MDDAMKYDVIYADPPWTFVTYSPKGKGRSAEAHYPCMTLAEIAALPVKQWAAQASVLYLWSTVPHLVNALSMIDAWGFRYVSAFVWVKDRIGTGYWARNRHEHLLIGARGSKVCPARGLAIDSVIEGQQRQHSQKPDRAAEIIEHYHPDARKLEMFARQRRPGWDVWGTEVGLLDHGPVTTRKWPSQGHHLSQGRVESSEAGA
jgi:N6-adenosine-specific RNA methylase IME4